MNIVNISRTLYLLPRARKHLLLVMQKLKVQSYVELINEPFDAVHSKQSVQNIVKSYFWAARLIKDCHCLPRSIALYQSLKAVGLEVEHKFGVNKLNEKLAAHAWVEYQHQPLNESEDLKSKFKVLEDYKKT